MKSLKDAFDRAKNPPRREMVLRYSGYRLNKSCTLCVVEGPSDKDFYKHSNIQILNSNCQYVWHLNGGMNPDADQQHKGKAAVIQTYFDIKNDIGLQGDLCRTIFIVDKDYDRELAHKNQILQQADRRCITTTRYHSFENYFITEGNVMKVFEMLETDSKYAHDFLQQIRDFSKEVAEYFSLLGAITACYKYGWTKPNYTNNRKGLFLSLFFDKSGSYVFDRQAMNSEIDKMIYVMRNLTDAKEYQKYLLKVLSDYKYIQGHLAFSFMQKYLEDILGIEFGFSKHNQHILMKYFQCINSMDVEIRLVTGLGKRLSDI